MKSKSIKKLYTLHSWVGIITGILLFVIAFTGAVSVFGRPELKMWANPEMRGLKAIDTAKVEELVIEYAKKVPDHYKEEVMIFLPGERGSKSLHIIYESHHGEPVAEEEHEAEEGHKKHNPPIGIAYEFNPYTYELVHEKSGLMEDVFSSYETDMADFIVTFHADLHLGRPIGLLTTGVLGLTMMLSIITGIFIHRKILGQMFTFRPQKNFSLLLNDGHKAIGVWGLLFNSVIAFTGAFLGLAVIVLVPAAAFVSFGGDQEKLIETFTAVPDPIIQHVEQKTEVAQILDHVFTQSQETDINAVTIKGYGDASAMVYVGQTGGERMAFHTSTYKGNGEYVETSTVYGRLEGYAGSILDVMFPLHFGNFGGIFVKVIWAILGLGSALLPLTGLMLWMERGVNAAHPKYSMQTYQRFNRLIVGGCGGIVIATLMLFPAQMAIKYVAGIKDVGSVIGWPFFVSWIAVILWAFIAKCEKRVAKQLTVLSAVMLMSILPIDMLVSGSAMLSDFAPGYYVSLGIDICCFALGIYLLKMLKKVEKVKSMPTQVEQADDLVQEGV